VVLQSVHVVQVPTVHRPEQGFRKHFLTSDIGKLGHKFSPCVTTFPIRERFIVPGPHDGVQACHSDHGETPQSFELGLSGVAREQGTRLHLLI
jgi:hypothetical protein